MASCFSYSFKTFFSLLTVYCENFPVFIWVLLWFERATLISQAVDIIYLASFFFCWLFRWYSVGIISPYWKYCSSEMVVPLVRCPSVLSNSLWPTRLLCPWDSPGKNAGVGCHFFLQDIFPTEGSNLPFLCLLHCRWIIFHWAVWKPVPLVHISNYSLG